MARMGKLSLRFLLFGICYFVPVTQCWASSLCTLFRMPNQVRLEVAGILEGGGSLLSLCSRITCGALTAWAGLGSVPDPAQQNLLREAQGSVFTGSSSGDVKPHLSLATASYRSLDTFSFVSKCLGLKGPWKKPFAQPPNRCLNCP